MNRILKLILLFIAVVLTFVFSPYTKSAAVCIQKSIFSLDSIQNIKKPSVVLISNNILKGDISSQPKENNFNFTGIQPHLTNYKSFSNSSNNTILHFNGEFFHNLSNKYEKIHKIRAP